MSKNLDNASRANLNGVVWVMGLCEERAFGR